MVLIVSAFDREIYAARRRLAQDDVVFAVTGMGADAARLRLREYILAYQPSRVIGIGIAASVDSSLARGTVLLIDRVYDGLPVNTGAQVLDCHYPEGLSPLLNVPIVSACSDSAILHHIDNDTRKYCINHGIVAYDMESYCYAELSAEYNIPFSALRIVSDYINNNPELAEQHLSYAEIKRTLELAEEALSALLQDIIQHHHSD